MRNIFTVGETTYDIIFRNNQPVKGIIGGSALNTAVSLGRLKLPVHFISRLGNDKIGDLSIRFLIDNEVNCKNIVRFDGNSRISLAIMDENNNAEYQFYKAQHSPTLQFPEPQNNDIILFGSTNAIQIEGRMSFIQFLKKATNEKALTIYDPNIREPDKNKLNELILKYEENLQFTQLLKGSDQDFQRIYETSEASEIFSRVSKFGIKALIVTAGGKPVQLITSKFCKIYPLQPVNTVSTIGAGDNFTTGIIAGFCKYHVVTENLDELPELIWDEIIETGNLLAAEVCQSEVNYISNDYAQKFKNQL